jgi:pimeloyl-ACP methyl ester carboxylesterase
MTDARRLGPEPFQIRIDQRELDDLRARLAHTRWTTPQPGAGWNYGTNPGYLRELIAYWRDGYDFRQHEARLNAVPQYKARVGGADLHFIHVHGHWPSATPLLLLHGWPDSFYRFHKVIPTLSDPARTGGYPGDAFDVVVPSLPGFTFTGRVHRPNDTQPTRHSARLLWQLMTEVLGYEHFLVAGGDGGSVLAQLIAIDHPESVIGVHLTDLGWHTFDVDPSSMSKAERKHLDASKKRFIADGAYALVQMTRPRSLAVALNDSPAALAAWIADRFHSWVDTGDGTQEGVSDDDLLTNITLYWLTQTIGSSIFNYYAEARSPSLTATDRVERPVALALFPKDIGGIPPRSFAERTLNVQRWTEMSRGGHFAALEQPELFARDLVEFSRTLKGRTPHLAPGTNHVATTL